MEHRIAVPSGRSDSGGSRRRASRPTQLFPASQKPDDLTYFLPLLPIGKVCLTCCLPRGNPPGGSSKCPARRTDPRLKRAGLCASGRLVAVEVRRLVEVLVIAVEHGSG